MKRLRWNIEAMWILLILAACVEPYDPPLDDAQPDYLVVDAFLDITKGQATVKLTRTLPVKSHEPVPSQRAAIVRIEDGDGLFYDLSESSPGLYTGNVISADPYSVYRLSIQTPDGHKYASDFVEVMATPPIDSITYSVKNDGIEFAVTTHDPANTANHFRWKFVETYEYHSNYHSNYMIVGGSAVLRPADLRANVCWTTTESKDIIVSSTEHLQQSVVSKFPVNFIPYGSLKLTVKYSLLLQQQTLTDEAYNYWINLEKSTEHLGGLFDPLPSEVPGNIFSTTHPDEKVIGFFSGSAVAESRMFLKRSELPNNIMQNFRNPFCPLDTIFNEELALAGPSTFLVDAIYPPAGGFGGPIGYTSTEATCVDCTLRGGTTLKPLFWE